MLELSWAILNIAILSYFIIIFFNAMKIISKRLGVKETIILVLGLLSFTGKASDENNENKTFNLQEESQKVEPPKFNGDLYSTKKQLEDNILADITISIYFLENPKEKKLLNASVRKNGYSIGTHWHTTGLTVNKLENNTYDYNVIGTVDWSILGINLYRELREFEGTIELKK